MRSLALVLFAFSAAAQPHLECATGPANNERVRELGAYSRVKTAQAKRATAMSIEERSGVFVLQADDATAPFRRPFDLPGKTLAFERRDAQTLAASIQPLAFDASLGSRVGIATENGATAVDLNFDFPFYDKTVRHIWVSGFNAIYLADPAVSAIDQRGDLELATTREGVIAPFLTTMSTQGAGFASVNVKQTADTATITWTRVGEYTMQATLSSSGAIRFSYPSMDNVIGGSIVVTSGSESWRSERVDYASTPDGTADYLRSVSPTLGPMLDLSNVTVSRVAGLDLVELRITTKAPLDIANVPANDMVIITVTFDNQRVLRYYLDRRGGDAVLYAVPAWGTKEGSPAARMEGSTLVLDVLQDYLAGFPNPATVVVQTALNSSGTIDLVNLGKVTLGAPSRQVHTDFSALEGSVELRGPVEEAFTLPVLSVEEVWSRLRAAYGLRDEEIDGVAIYQNFFTDLILYAGAYSTGGNPGVKGIADFADVGPNVPRAPALLHMNKVGYGVNRDARAASHVIMHELGHRWMFYFSIMENGSRSFVLNPISAHPAQYVDTRAAFPVYLDVDSSVMGGGTFADNHDGSFTSSAYASYGYSWLDLYLMGLADKSEVTPWFYIANSNPRLGDAYYPPERRTYRGTRRDVGIQQVVDAMGARSPAYPGTQRTFRVAFVLLADPDRPVSESEVALVQQYRGLLETNFPMATAERGNVTTSIVPAPPPPRRRAVR
ncbi:MAG TPA: hypothetical protein VGR02_23140 [Thermoanaerobaculia bacterium]|jgi:hypothetical protein|nr:hypothetical protein [Thermoanaerobaculia bacterium]